MYNKSLFIKIYSIIIGAISGFWIGTIFGVFIAAFIFGFIFQHNIYGEESLGVALAGFVFGAPVGIFSGALFSYKKRHNKIWMSCLSVLILIIIFIYFLPVLISPLGEIMKLFNN